MLSIQCYKKLHIIHGGLVVKPSMEQHFRASSLLLFRFVSHRLGPIVGGPMV